jgi:hypothetical protein
MSLALLDNYKYSWEDGATFFLVYRCFRRVVSLQLINTECRKLKPYCRNTIGLSEVSFCFSSFDCTGIGIGGHTVTEEDPSETRLLRFSGYSTTKNHL